MGPIAAVGHVVMNYFNFEGRAPRSEFWWWSVLQFLIVMIAITLDIALLDPATLHLSDINFFSFFTPFVVLFTIIPSLSVAVRRLHDSGRSGFWYLISFVPFGALVLFVFYCMPSERDENIYGPPPGGPRAPPGGYDIKDPFAAPKKVVKSNAFASYAVLAEGRETLSDADRAQQKEQIRNYYRERVLGNQTGAA